MPRDNQAVKSLALEIHVFDIDSLVSALLPLSRYKEFKIGEFSSIKRSI